MAHIHELIDFTVNAYIVYEEKVLLIKHINLDKWLPVGGHIELNEDPIEALLREVKEESGLDIEILSKKHDFKINNVKALYPPVFLNIHEISAKHKHIAMNYFAKAKTDKVVLEEDEHEEIKWFSKNELDDPKYNLQEDIKYYAKEALIKIANWN